MATKQLVSIITILIISVMLNLFTLNNVHAQGNPPVNVDAIYQFGDSLADTGNLIRENPIGGYYFARPPYGVTFGHPTGRCSNGLLIIDHIARYFKLPLLNPYLKEDGNFTYGVNFAVAGATALPATSFARKNMMMPVTNSSLAVQLKWFRSHLASICSNKQDCKNKLKNALFFMGEIGGNDFNYALVGGQSMEDLRKMVPSVVHTIKRAAREVIHHGAKRMVVPGNFPIGCMPIYLANFKTDNPAALDKLGCLKVLNDLADYQNSHVRQAVRELQAEHPHVTIVYGDYFNALKQIIRFAPLLGFEKDATTKACCGNGSNAYNFNMTQMCGSPEAEACPNPFNHVNWDGVHLTSHSYYHVARRILRDLVPALLTS